MIGEILIWITKDKYLKFLRTALKSSKSLLTSEKVGRITNLFHRKLICAVTEKQIHC